MLSDEQAHVVAAVADPPQDQDEDDDVEDEGVFCVLSCFGLCHVIQKNHISILFYIIILYYTARQQVFRFNHFQLFLLYDIILYYTILIPVVR